MNATAKNIPTKLQANGRSSTVLPAGTPAPEFSLLSTPDQTVKLSEFRGRPVVLAFYPADWSPVCGDQMALYNEMLSEFQEFGAELFGISVDGVMRRFPGIANCISRCWLILSRRERLPGSTAHIAKMKASVNAPFSCLMRMA